MNKEYTNDTLNFLKEYLPKLEQMERENKLGSREKILLKHTKEVLKYKRINTFEGSDLSSLINHEYGHHIDNNLNKIIESKGLKKDEILETLKDAIKGTNDEAYKHKLSYYAFENIFVQRQEVFAEAYSLFSKNLQSDLHPSFIKLFNYVTK